MSSKDYDNVLPGTLKLKGVGIVKKKKKSKKSDATKLDQHFQATVNDSSGTQNLSNKTEAELKFERIQKQRLKEKVEDLAKKSHKDKVQEFNKKLEELSEHYDIPKVGPG